MLANEFYSAIREHVAFKIHRKRAIYVIMMEIKNIGRKVSLTAHKNT
jgi:hypothetical protein